MPSLRDIAQKGEQFLSRLSQKSKNGQSQPIIQPQEDLLNPGPLPPLNPPPVGKELSISVHVLGKTTLRKGFVDIARDGGGGGRVNGKNIVLFSDTLVRGVGPITNTICYSSELNPVVLEDFGRNGVPVQGIPYLEEEKEYTDKGAGKTRVVVWPQSQIIQLPGDRIRGIGIAPVSIQSAPDAPQPSRELYNSLYTITAGNIPTVVRTVPKLWHAGSVLYGTFTTCLVPLERMLYFFAVEGSFFTQNSGIKVARASLDSYTDKSKESFLSGALQWSFWTGFSWTNEPPQPNTAQPIMPGVYSSGDIFFSPYLGTYLAVYFLATADSTFRYRYVMPNPETGHISLTGPWSDEFVLYDTSAVKAKSGGYGFNYAGHAYPHYDPTGRTLVLSCTSSDGATPWFFRATFHR